MTYKKPYSKPANKWVNMPERQPAVFLKSNVKKVGQHPRISTAKKNKSSKKRVGQHPGTVGQHKTEWWVNMIQNLHPGFTESGRWRTDFKLDTKYDLPLDFYIKFSVTLNYDNQPAVAGKETDYVYVFSVGWEL